MSARTGSTMMSNRQARNLDIPRIVLENKKPALTTDAPRKYFATSYFDLILSFKSLSRSSDFMVSIQRRVAALPSYSSIQAASEPPSGKVSAGNLSAPRRQRRRSTPSSRVILWQPDNSWQPREPSVE